MKSSIVLLGFGFAGLTFAAGCGSIVTRSGVGDTQSTTSTGSNTTTVSTGSDGSGGRAPSSSVTTASGEGGCDANGNGDQFDCPPPVDPIFSAIAIKWGDVPS